MTNVNFEVFKFDRQAKEVLLYHNSVLINSADELDIVGICRVLRLLYPAAAGVRVTIM